MRTSDFCLLVLLVFETGFSLVSCDNLKQNKDGFSFGLDDNSVVNEIRINSKVWFTVSPEFSRIFVRQDGKTFSYFDGTMELKNSTTSGGRDVLGVYEETTFFWSPDELNFKTRQRTYEGRQVFVMKQEFTNFEASINRTQMSDGVEAYNLVSSSFPSLAPVLSSPGDRRGFMSFGGNMAGWTALSVAELSSAWEVPIRGGELGGPAVFFDETGSEVVIASPLSQFMATNMEVRHVKNESTSTTFPVLDFGLMGSVQEIPAPGLELEFVFVFGSSFDDAFERWGDILLRYHDKKKDNSGSIASDYLGYWTDNGAFYYYNTLGQNISYEETLIELHKHFNNTSLPVQYVEIDSWWYYKGELQGVTNWTELPDIFPRGLDYVQQATGWPIAAHNRYWSKDNVYAEQNGGQFQFYMEENGALPKDEAFWYFLFNEASKWGLEVYEQDWLDIQYRLARITHTDLNAARDWLLEMGRGALVNGIDLIYCMALPREILQSVEIEAVKSARVSGDYILSRDQWRVGLSSFLSSSLGLAPFKDVFWTREENSGNPFYSDCMIVSNNTDPNIPWTLNYRYNGYKNVTKSGKPCLTWYDLDLHWLAPNGDLERDACRTLSASPWGEGKPFCFVKADPSIDPTLWEWEECEIPICGADCIRENIDLPDEDLPICDPVREPNPRLQTVVSVLSRGGVGIGDKMNNIDGELTMKSCRKDGQIIRPDKSIRAAPAQILRMAFGGDRVPTRPHSSWGEIWQTSTTIENLWNFPIVFAAETKGFGFVEWDMLGLTGKTETYSEEYTLSLADISDKYANAPESSITRIKFLEPIGIPELGEDQFVVFHFSPIWRVLNLDVSLLGEVDKIVPISNDRIVSIDFKDDQIAVLVQGSEKEEVKISWAVFTSSEQDKAQTVEATCVMPRSGYAKLLFDANTMTSRCVNA